MEAKDNIVLSEYRTTHRPDISSVIPEFASPMPLIEVKTKNENPSRVEDGPMICADLFCVKLSSSFTFSKFTIYSLAYAGVRRFVILHLNVTSSIQTS